MYVRCMHAGMYVFIFNIDVKNKILVPAIEFHATPKNKIKTTSQQKFPVITGNSFNITVTTTY